VIIGKTKGIKNILLEEFRDTEASILSPNETFGRLQFAITGEFDGWGILNLNLMQRNDMTEKP